MTTNATFAENVSLAVGGFPAGASGCDHDWRVNPVVCATTATGDAELLMCVKCQTQRAGTLLRHAQPSSGRPFDPSTWDRRAA